jgi:hypothetical protein
VNADHASTGRTLVFLGLPAQELVDAIVSDELEVFDHAHLVLLAIALVETLQLGTRKGTALEAEFYFAVQEGWTLALDEGAFLVAGTTAGAVNCLASLPRDSVRPGQVGTADATVHSARSNQSLFHTAFPLPPRD